MRSRSKRRPAPSRFCIECFTPQPGNHHEGCLSAPISVYRDRPQPRPGDDGFPGSASLAVGLIIAALVAILGTLVWVVH